MTRHRDLEAPRRLSMGRLIVSATVGAALALVATPGAAHADHEELPSGRTLKPYVVKSGDTATGLAVRFHAWTAELISHNHLGPSGALRVGQRIEIPVVTRRGGGKEKGKEKGKSGPSRTRMWKHPEARRERVRRVVSRTARRHGVDPQLATAISWQESGWAMHHVSSAGAIGAMQVLPSTGRWMEFYAGRDLRLRRLKDNALAGVLLLKWLDGETTKRRHVIAGYYQGLGAVRRHGIYRETRPYIANVVAIKHRLEAGRPPS